MDAAPAVEPYVTVRRAARAFGIGRHLIFHAAERGELEVLDVGGWARCRVSAVQAWLESTKRLPRGAA
jgi:hypothetical protein